MAITIVVTTAGRAALVNPANTGTNAVTITQLGVTETAFIPAVGLVALPGEVKRIASVAGVVVGDDAIHVTASDVTPSVYTMRGFGLYLGDGTLFATYGQAGPILNKPAESMMLLALDVKFENIEAETILFGDTNFILPPATTEILGLVELATTAEGQAGNDPTRVLTPMVGKQSVLGWLLSQDGAGSGLDADLLDGRHAYEFVLDTNFTGGGVLGRLLTVDGAGSGLDADLLDGQQGAYYLPTASYTAADVAAKILTVDGAGSGLDADLLDGKHASEFAGAVHSHGTMANQNANAVDISGGEIIGLSRFEVRGDVKSRQLGGGRVIASNANDGTTVEPAYSRLILTGGSTESEVASWRGANHFANTNATTLSGWVRDSGGTMIERITVRGSSGFVGINQLNPAAMLHVKSSGVITILETTRPRGSGSCAQYWRDTTGDKGYFGYASLFNDQLYLMNSMNSDMLLGTNNIDRWRIAASGSGELTPVLDDSSYIGALTLRPIGGYFSRFVNIAGNNAWHAGNDGAGSGLDADLLDGRHAYEFVLDTNFTGGGVLGRLLTVDGAGSGLDADLLDGLQAAAFVKYADFTGSDGTTGYRILPGPPGRPSLLLQWGTYTVGSNSATSPNFPTGFPTACVWADCNGGRAIADTQNNNPFVSGHNQYGLTIYSATNSTVSGTWFAIGY